MGELGLQDIWTGGRTDRVIPIYFTKLYLQGYNKLYKLWVNNNLVHQISLSKFVLLLNVMNTA